MNISKKLRQIAFNITLIFATSLLFTACMSSSYKGLNKTSLQNKSVDVIIVPGVPFDDGEWSDIMKIRVYWAAHLYKTGLAKNIIFSGSSVYTPYVESKIMRLYAEKLGIPSENIFTEERAEHSSENLYYSYKMASDLGFQSIALATDPFQSFFLKRFIKKMELDDLGVLPINFNVLKKMDKYTPSIDPSPAYVNDFVSLVDRQSKKVRSMGTKGKFIQYDEGDSPAEKRNQKRAKMSKTIDTM